MKNVITIIRASVEPRLIVYLAVIAILFFTLKKWGRESDTYEELKVKY